MAGSEEEAETVVPAVDLDIVAAYQTQLLQISEKMEKMRTVSASWLESIPEGPLRKDLFCFLEDTTLKLSEVEATTLAGPGSKEEERSKVIKKMALKLREVLWVFTAFQGSIKRMLKEKKGGDEEEKEAKKEQPPSKIARSSSSDA